jgi:hypothetical protein
MMRAFPKFVVRLALLAGMTHVCFSGLLTLVVEKRFPHRMLNVRAIEPDDRPARNELIASFLGAAKRDGRPLIGFFGSSFTYGYPFPPSSPLSGETAEAFPDHRVVNVSVLSSGLDAIHTSIELAALQGCRFEILVIEIPVVNETSFLPKNPQGWRKDFVGAHEDVAHAEGATHFQWFLKRPSGVRYLAIMFEELTLANDEIPLSLVQPYDGYFATREKFEVVRGEYADKVAVTLKAAQAISDRVVAFPTPVYLAGNGKIRYDAAALREQIDATYAACGAVEGVTTVRFDERFLQDGNLFCNLTHLGLRGNREFGAWLAGEIRRPSGETESALAANPGDPASKR